MVTTLINVYAPNGSSDQKLVWDDISELKVSFSNLWILGVILTQFKIRVKEVIVWGC